MFARCVVVFLMAFLADVVAAVHIRALVDNALVLAAGSIGLLHFLGFFSTAWFADSKQTKRRLLLTLASALGAAAGTTLVILCAF